MNDELKILILEDDPVDADFIKKFLERSGLNISAEVVSNRKEFIRAIETSSFDIILSDHKLPQFSSSEALEICHEKKIITPFILVTGTVSEEFAVSIMHHGADDYILKSNLNRLPSAIRQAIEKHRMLREKKKAEEELLNTFERITDAFVSLDRNWNYTYLNKRAAKMHGREPEELIGKNIWKEFPEVLNEPFYKALHAAMENQKSQRVQLYYSKTDSWYEDFIYPSSDGVSVYYQDITEKKKAEDELQKSELRYRSLIEQASDGIFITDENGKYIVVNSSACKLLGYTSEELLTLFMSDVLAGAGQKGKPAQWDSLSNGDSAISERKMKRKDGSLVDVEISSKMLPNGNFQGIVRNITERKKAEEKLKLSHQQLRNLASHLQSVREEERLRIAREIHDELGQQLTGLKMDVAWLDKKLPDVNSGIKEKVSGMLSLIDETVKTVRRISSDLRPGILDDLGLVAALDWQSHEFEKRSGIMCTFTTEFSDENIDKAIATSIFRIYQETLTNVARHAGATEVKADFRKEGDNMLLIISDNGKGFNSEEAKTKMTLGIIGMKERALVMHGELSISSEPGKGTSVRVKVPASVIKKYQVT
jgi:PAS domain S-box-containing protein